MLSGKYRFHSRGGVKFVYRNGKLIRRQKISLVYLSENKRRNSRFAVVVSKKVLKSAVGRNRIRRRVYEVIRAEFPKVRELVDVIVVVYSKEVESMPYEELMEALRELFEAAELYKSGV